MMALAPLARHPALLSLGWALFHFLWQGAVVAALLGAALHVLRCRSAQARYLAACAGLLVMAACPVVTMLATRSASPTASRELLTAEAQRRGRGAPKARLGGRTPGALAAQRTATGAGPR